MYKMEILMDHLPDRSLQWEMLSLDQMKRKVRYLQIPHPNERALF